MGRQKYSADFKAKVALEAIKGMRTIGEIASQYGVHPTIISMWKKQALDQLPEVFRDKRKRGTVTDNGLQDRLYQQIGQLQVELDWLKKKTGHSI